MNPSYRQTMIAGMKIHVMDTGIKDGYLTIMNLLRDESPSREPGLLGIILQYAGLLPSNLNKEKKKAPSSLPTDVMSIILQYAGLLPSNLNIDLDKLIIKKTSSTDLEAEERKQNFALKNPVIPERRLLPVCTLRRGQ